MCVIACCTRGGLEGPVRESGVLEPEGFTHRRCVQRDRDQVWPNSRSTALNVSPLDPLDHLGQRHDAPVASEVGLLCVTSVGSVYEYARDQPCSLYPICLWLRFSCVVFLYWLRNATSSCSSLLRFDLGATGASKFIRTGGSRSRPRDQRRKLAVSRH